MVGLALLVIPSPATPVSLAVARPVMLGLAVGKTSTVRATEVVAVLPTESVILTV